MLGHAKQQQFRWLKSNTFLDNCQPNAYIINCIFKYLDGIIGYLLFEQTADVCLSINQKVKALYLLTPVPKSSSAEEALSKLRSSSQLVMFALLVEQNLFQWININRQVLIFL